MSIMYDGLIYMTSRVKGMFRTRTSKMACYTLMETGQLIGQYLFIYLGINIPFNTVQVISQWIVLWGRKPVHIVG